MFGFPIKKWYTDLVTINREESYLEGNLTKQKRVMVAENVPCRIYSSSNPHANLSKNAAEVNPGDMMACRNDVDIKPGDELMVIRGGGLGKKDPPVRYFAGEFTKFYEPFGGVVPGMAHQRVPLSGERRT